MSRLWRTLIEVVLTQGTKFGLDAAGSLLGPAWPIVKPILEQVVDDVGEDVTSRFSTPTERLQAAMAKLEAEEAQVALVERALADAGLTEAWADGIVRNLETLSDDVFTLLLNQAKQRATLEDLLKITSELRAKKPGHLALRGQRLEYIEYVTVGADFLSATALAPGSWNRDPDLPRHLPAGAFVWNFQMLNDGEQLVTVSSIGFEVVAEDELPAGAAPGELRPLVNPFEDEIALRVGAKRYDVFEGKLFKYAPQEDVDLFRIRAMFREPARRYQALRPVIAWEDGTGQHLTYGEPLYLAALPNPQVIGLERKVRFGAR